MQSAFATGPGQPRDEVAVCMCPISKLIGNPMQIHPGSGMAWGTCPASQCDALTTVQSSARRAQLSRFGRMQSCQKGVAPVQSTSWF